MTKIDKFGINLSMIQRKLRGTIVNNLKPGFINLIYGARRVGKTVLLEQIKQKLNENKILSLNGDTQETRDLLSTTSEVKLSEIVKNYPIIFIDEAQRIKDISLALKIIIDKFPKKKIFVTGSSSLSLSKGARETLTGRVKVFKLFPLSFEEITSGQKGFQKDYFLENLLIYGGYPYLLNLGNPEEKQEYLKTIVEDYLFRDVLLLENIINPDLLPKLATLLAFQIGQEVSLNELSRNLGIEVSTVSRYLTLLEQSFIIFPLSAFSNNQRKEITKSKKYYFYDLGIRNSLVKQFSPLNLRPDTGHLWENFLAIERIKKQHYSFSQADYYFWRNYDNAEIDFIEKTAQTLQAFEFKWKKSKYSTPKAFLDNYKTKAKLISKENYKDFLLEKL